MAAWGRLALLHVARDQPAALEQVAQQWGYVAIEKPDESALSLPPEAMEVINDRVEFEKPLKPPASKATSPAVPNSTFIAVDSIHDKRQQNQLPETLRAGEPLRPRDHGTYLLDNPPTLISPARYLPLLQNALGAAQATKKIHSRLLCKRLGAGKTLQRIPKVVRRCWPNKLLVIVECGRSVEPHWQDFANIVQQLKQLLGAYKVTAIRFDQHTLNSDLPSYSPWPENKQAIKYEGNPLPHYSSLLLLSDLGMTSTLGTGYWHLSPLLQWLKQYVPRDLAIINFSPAAASTNFACINRLLYTSPLNDESAMPRHPQAQGFNFCHDAAQKQTTLLAVFSQIPYFDVALLRKVRRQLNLGGSHLETWLWNHDDTEIIDLGCRVKPVYKETHQADITQALTALGENKRSKFWHTVNQHFSQAYQGLHQLTQLMQIQAEGAHSVSPQTHKQVINYFQQLAFSAYQLQNTKAGEALARQCKTAFHYLNFNFRHHQQPDLASSLAAVAYWQQLQQEAWPADLPDDMRGALAFGRGNAEKISKVRWQLTYNTNGHCSLGQQTQQDADQPPTILASFTALAGEENQVSVLTKAGAKPSPISASQACEFTLQWGESATIENSLQSLRVQAMRRPPWAKALAYREGKLFATLRHISEVGKVQWQPATVSQAAPVPSPAAAANLSRWHWPKPIQTLAEDKYGYYLDLNLIGLIERFRWIPQGRFQMGSPESERGRDSDETLHSVEFSEGFWLAETTVSQALWQGVMKGNPSHFKGNDLPVDSVSWNDTQDFLKQLSALAGIQQFRLPTEAEWEYACRAATSSAFYWGRDLNLTQANYCGNWDSFDNDEKALKKTSPVRSFRPNPWGLYQMHGNVWEWCNDWYSDYPKGEVMDPQGPAVPASDDEALRVLRGGSWSDYGRNLRAADRRRGRPDGRGHDWGFRLALGRELRGGGAASPAGVDQPAAEQRHRDGPEAPKNAYGKPLNRFRKK